MVAQQKLLTFQRQEAYYFKIWLLQWNFAKLLKVLTLLTCNNHHLKIIYKNCHNWSETRFHVAQIISDSGKA